MHQPDHVLPGTRNGAFSDLPLGLNALTIQNFPTSVQELSSEVTVLTFKLSNQIEPSYLQYSSHADGHSSRYVDTTAILRPQQQQQQQQQLFVIAAVVSTELRRTSDWTI